MTRLTPRKTFLDVVMAGTPCPTCLVDAGRRCRTKLDVTRTPHPSRIRAHNDLIEAERRAHARPDEVLDVDFDPTGVRAWDREEQFAADCCERCGVHGHHGPECRTITPDLLKAAAS